MSEPIDPGALPAGTARVRINLKYTQREGWTVGETTVEVAAPIGEGRAARVIEMRQAYLDGAREAQWRNANPIATVGQDEEDYPGL